MSQDAHPLPDPFLRLTAADVPCAAPVFVQADDSVAEAARAMARAGATAALVRPAGHGPGTPAPPELLGILTERDVLARVVAAGLDPAATTAAQVMTPRLITVRPGEPLIEAFSLMLRRGVRRLVLLDASGAVGGILGEGDMLAARGESPLALAAEINAAADQAALARAFSRLSRLAARSVAEGIDARAVGRLISHMHDRIMTQAWGLALGETEAALGPAPARHAVCVLGSQARREQYLATDQDLALAWERLAQDAERAGAWFGELGARLTRLLSAVGFPPCPKRIMADNPAWRRSSDAWLDLADAIAARPEGEGVVTASLLADLRPLDAPAMAHGACCRPELGLELRQELDRRFRGSALLLKCMAREAVRFSPPLGLFRGFSPDRDGRLDLKRGGVFPVTQGAKALGLLHALEETGTLERLEALGRAGALSRPLAQGLCEGCALLQTLRMRAQARALASGETPDNAIRPEDLGRLEAERLRAAFKLVAELQELLSAAFALHLMA